MTTWPIEMPEAVRAAYAAIPGPVRARLLEVRALLLRTAEEVEAGPLTEALRWGEPAYLTLATRSGSPVRLGWSVKDPEAARVYFICTTGLVDEMRAHFSAELCFEGNRVLRLPMTAPVPEEAVRACLAMALTHKRRRAAWA